MRGGEEAEEDDVSGLNAVLYQHPHCFYHGVPRAWGGEKSLSDGWNNTTPCQEGPLIAPVICYCYRLAARVLL